MSFDVFSFCGVRKVRDAAAHKLNRVRNRNVGGRDEGRKQSAFSSIIFFFEFGSAFARLLLCELQKKEKKRMQAKRIKAIREITPDTKRPEVNRGEALSK